MEKVLGQYHVKVLVAVTKVSRNYVLLQIKKKIKLAAVKLVAQPNVWQVQTTYSQTASSCLINSTDKGRKLLKRSGEEIVPKMLLSSRKVQCTLKFSKYIIFNIIYHPS